MNELKKPFTIGRFQMQPHLDKPCWVAPGGQHIYDERLARKVASDINKRMKRDA